MLIIRLNVAFVDGDLLKGGDSFLKENFLKDKYQELKFLRKKIIPESEKIT